MGLYNFQSRFVPFIERGEKTHTIRGLRDNPDKVGNVMHLFTGLRHPGARLLMRAPCVKVEEILIDFLLDGWPSNPKYVVTIDGERLDLQECDAFSVRDGFNNFADMVRFWREPKMRLPFKGHIYHWDFKRRVL